jgi:periplasmic divalent cation tolerance protein
MIAIGYITTPNTKAAENIARHLIGLKLIACANIIKSTSMYKWDGKLTRTSEAILLVKTTKGKWNRIKEAVKKKHPYKIPCILLIDAQSDPIYEKWVKDEISSS